MQTSGGQDHLTASVLQFLESHQGVCNVALAERTPALQRDITAWEKLHAPLQLPADVKSFYSMSDGFHLTWAIKMKEDVVPLGNLHINSLSHVKRFKANKFRICGKTYSPSEDADSEDEDVYGSSSSFSSSSFPQAFDIDSTCRDGHVALMYFSATQPPEVYFQDLSTRWYFVAKNFKDYHRLMLMHVGIQNWQYAFTDAGLTPATKQWFCFLSPQRLAIDLSHGRSNSAQWLATQQSSASAASKQHHRRSSSTLSSGHAHASSVDLAKIDQLAQSVITLQQGGKQAKSIPQVTKKSAATNVISDGEEE